MYLGTDVAFQREKVFVNYFIYGFNYINIMTDVDNRHHLEGDDAQNYYDGKLKFKLTNSAKEFDIPKEITDFITYNHPENVQVEGFEDI